MIYLTLPWGVGEEPRRILVPRPLSSKWATELSSLGSIVNSLVDYVFAAAGFILLIMIIISGYRLMTSAGNPEAMAKGKSRLTAALIGFVIVFASFWIYQIIEVLLGGSGNVFVRP